MLPEHEIERIALGIFHFYTRTRAKIGEPLA
jgi:hypothetical protein